MAPYNPFGFGLYGGSQSAGFLESDPTLRPFLEKRGYKVAATSLIFQRHLDRPFNVIDGRFPVLRRRYEVRSLPRRGTDGWYQEGVRGPLLEPQEFRLEDRTTGEAAGHASVWEMDPFSDRWNEHAVGIVAVDVAEGHRRQGLARLLLGQVLRFYHDQYFTLAEAQVSPDNAPALGLVRGLGFHQVDAGHLFRKR
jgi:ribosomal protein S18 acetylase RimI-like enzyme